VIGPTNENVRNAVIKIDGLTWLYEFGGAIGGLIFGLLYAPIVITGMHHSFIAVETTLIADATKTGGSFI
jgi:PTS system sucrose-specific IIC component